MLHCHIDFFTDTRNAGRKTCRGQVRSFDIGEKVRLVWQTGKAARVWQIKTFKRDVWEHL